jgi:cell division initiation protein
MPTPGDLLNKRFEKANFGGYKTADVDSFMVDSASVMSQLNRETAELKRKLEAAEKNLISYQNEEESLKSTLLSAQRLADKIVKDAQSKADLTISDAQNKADLTIRDAENKADLTIMDAQNKADNLIEKVNSEIEHRRDEAKRIKQEVSDFKLKVMRIYRTHLELINSMPSESDTPEAENEDALLFTPPQTIEPKDETLQEKAVEETPPPALEPEEEPIQPIQEEISKEPETTDQTELLVENETKAQVAASVKLNLRYNQKTGEYEPINAPMSENSAAFSSQQTEKGSIKFGAAYDISTDSFKNGPQRHNVKP